MVNNDVGTVTKGYSKKIYKRSTSSSNCRKPSRKKNANTVAFSPSPEQKSPKKPRHTSQPKPPNTPTLKSSAKSLKLKSPIVLIQTKRKITKAIKAETESESDSASEEKELDSDNEEVTQEDEEEAEDEEEEDDEDQEEEDSDANFIDDEA
ncbi:hypothetical protein GALMADRAFT_149206, partial [Galerina marginata CBS 339.88]